MVERPMPRAQLRRMPDGTLEVLAGQSQCRLDVRAKRQLRSRRGGEGAPGAVGMARVDPRSSQLELAVASADHIDDVADVAIGAVPAEVAALHHYDAGTHRADPPRGHAHIVD